MVKKDSESDDYYEGVKKFDCSFADFDAYMNDLDMEIESRFGPIGLGLWLGSGVKKIKRATLAQTVERMRFCYEHHRRACAVREGEESSVAGVAAVQESVGSFEG